MKRYIFIFFLISGCVSNQTEKNNNFYDKDFSDKLSFKEFKIKLKEYANNSPYPNIDN